MDNLSQNIREDVLSHFLFEGSLGPSERNTIGRINDTYILDYGQKKYVLQRINDHVFSSPENVMANIEKVTSFLAAKIQKRSGDPHRETLTIIPTKDGKTFYKNDQGYWRVYLDIDNTLSYNQATPTLFYEAAGAFSRFQKDLSDFPASDLQETIKGFHDTKSRFSHFLKAIRKDVKNRGASAQEEIEFLRENKTLAYELGDQVRKKGIPLRVTHNDTKLNNVLFDKTSGKAVAVIDLDTVMPGLSITDFGDAIRFGANTAGEEEADLAKIGLDMTLFTAFTKGYLEGVGSCLSESEIALMPLASETMAYELALRFLTDYLEGDVYFKVTSEFGNLTRARGQIALLKDMLAKHERMLTIVQDFQKKQTSGTKAE